MAIRYDDLRLYILEAGDTDFTLTPADGAFNVLGNGDGNKLTGNAFDNVLNGGAGADTLIGGAGNDTYVIDNVGDTVTEANEVGVDLVRSTVTFTLATAGAAFVENLTLAGTTDIDGTGNDLGNVILGNSGANSLDVGKGADSLFGGGGIDTLIGGEGNDTLDGGDGIDEMAGGVGDDLYIINDATEVITEAAGAGTDTVSSSVTYSIADKANLENIILTGTGALNATGNAGNNSLTGNSGVNVLAGADGNDTLDGGAGADRLDGGAGDDTYVVDNTGDVIVDTTGVDTVVSSLVSYTLGANLENARAAVGVEAFNLTGNGANNTLTGNAGANVLDGGAGVDQLIGGAGNDTYLVDDTLDLVTEAAGGGTDTVLTSVRYALATASEVEVLTATGRSSINLTGSEFANAINGNAGRNAISGLGGNDVLNGGLGRDDLRGGAGRDTFEFDTRLSSSNVDRVLDFNVRDDSFALDNAIFRRLGSGTEERPGKLKSGYFKIATDAQDSNDYLLYDRATGVLSYDADGSGAGREIAIATLRPGLRLTSSDFVII
jgi:Ca2+-binding RTX toxin-like protein